MAVMVQLDIFCDVCSQWETPLPGSTKKMAVRRKAQKHGWTSRKMPDGRYQDVCPHCTKVLAGT